MTRLSASALALLLLAPAFPAAAGVRALLIGVGDYAYLEPDLKGPEADVRLMAETLLARGLAAADLTVLTTDPAGLPRGATAGEPTRAGILGAMAATAAASGAGDTVVFYFSGHGSQAPDLSGDEGGGYDEIFLPSDASGWRGDIGMVENALLDDELRDWAEAMLARGVRLVGLIDACHSATGFRALEGAGVARMLEPDALGIPDSIAPGPGAAPPPAPLPGEYVFLYSSQSDERSFEYPLGDTGEWHGEFTLRLAQALAAAPGASWRRVLATAADAMVQGPARQLPEGEGPLLDAPVFGEGTQAPRFRLRDGRLQAGLLQGLEVGAELALYAEGAGGAPIGAARVAKATAREARIEAAAGGKLPEGASWAEVSAAAPARPVTLAAPVRGDPDDGHDYGEWLAALPASAPAPGKAPDLVPFLVDGAVALALADGVLDPAGPGTSPRIRPAAGESVAQAVARAIDTASRGLRLRATLAGAAGRGLTATPAIAIDIARRPAAATGAGCAPPGPAEPWDGTDAQPCDQLWLGLRNASGKAQDVSVLYMAADFAVQPIWPQANIVNRLAPGESVRVGLQIEAAAPPGIEEIWVLAVPVDKAAGQRVDLTRLAMPQAQRDLAGAADDAMTSWLEGRLEEDGAALRGFTLKPADLVMFRQVVRLKPGTP